MDPSEEREVRVGAVQGALEAVILSSMDPEVMRRLSRLVLETRDRRAGSGRGAAVDKLEAGNIDGA